MAGLQCLRNVNWTTGDKFLEIVNGNSNNLIQENAFENVAGPNGGHFVSASVF